MAHVLALVEGPDLWYKLFLDDLEKQQYTYKATHGKIGIIGPMIRELHILDITVPEQCLNDLFSDLGPFVNPTTKQKVSALFVRKATWLAGKLSSLFKGAKLNPVPNITTASGNVRRRALNIMPLFWFEDPITHDNDQMVLPEKGDGGELL